MPSAIAATKSHNDVFYMMAYISFVCLRTLRDASPIRTRLATDLVFVDSVISSALYGPAAFEIA